MTFPSCPEVATILLALDVECREGQEVLVGLVAQNADVAARIVCMANCARFAGRAVSDVREAIARIGWQRTKAITLYLSVSSALVHGAPGAMQANEIWRHSLAVAMIMETLSSFMRTGYGPSDEAIYTAGLMHDIGFVVLNDSKPALGQQLFLRLKNNVNSDPAAIEQAMLAVSHSELGARLALHWHLPNEVVAVIRYHHTPRVSDARPGWPMVMMAYAAEELLPAFYVPEKLRRKMRDEEWQSLGIDPEQAGEIEAAVLARRTEIEAMAL